MKGTIFFAASALLLSALLAGCADDGGVAGADAGPGDAGPLPPKPIDWKPLPEQGAPSPRYLHTAIWTGSKMIIWGGTVKDAPYVTATGAIYDPATRTWSPTSMTGAPSARSSHSAVWTGSKMIIWGGFGESTPAADGAMYDPAADTWAPISMTGQPMPRTSFSAVWTGKVMIVWGGLAGGQPLASGGIYDPATDSWTASSASGAPSKRLDHSGVWTGSRMIVWGGQDFSDWQATGASLDISGGGGGAWVGATLTEGAPTARERHTGVWTGSKMLIWGGWTGGPYENTGGLFDPASGAGGSWQAMSNTGAPSPRMEHVGVWAGDEFVVWGGCGDDSCNTVYGDGGRFTPSESGGSWTPVAEQAGLSPRRGATGVTSGSTIIIWGGRLNAKDMVGTGAESVL